MLPEPIAVTLEVTEAFDALGVPYVIAGSLAGAVHGVVRATLDSDLLADLKLEQANELVKRLEQRFYIQMESVQEAIRSKASFSAIHLEHVFKVDVFISKGRAFEASRFARRQKERLSSDPERSAYVSSAEDTLLAKLEWYRLGQETSERQWRDVLGILRIQKEALDVAYLRRWAAELGVENLLQKALEEAGTLPS